MIGGGWETLARRMAAVLAVMGALMLIALPVAHLAASQGALAEARALHERASARTGAACLGDHGSAEALAQALSERWGGDLAVSAQVQGDAGDRCQTLILDLDGAFDGPALAQLLHDLAREPALAAHDLDCAHPDSGRIVCSGRAEIRASLR